MHLLIVIILSIMITACTGTTFTPYTPLLGNAKTYPPYKGKVKILNKFEALLRPHDKIGTLRTTYIDDLIINEAVTSHLKSEAAKRGANAIIISGMSPETNLKEIWAEVQKNPYAPAKEKIVEAIAIRLKE